MNGENEKLRLILERYAESVAFSDLGALTVNTKSIFGDLPIHAAALHGNLEDVIVLLEHGSDVNALGEDNDTPLHNAVSSGNIEVVKLLLENGANLSAKGHGGDTPLELALIIEQNEIATLLQNYDKT